MGTAIILFLIGGFIIISSKTATKLISMQKKSKALEVALRIFLISFGLFFIVFGFLIAFDDVPYITTMTELNAYIFTVVGAAEIALSPFQVNHIMKKYHDNESIKLIGRKGLYLLHIGIGIVALVIGLFGLTGLI